MLVENGKKNFPFFRLDTSKNMDFKEAFNVTEPYNDQIPWPTGECSDFKPTVNSFFRTCEKLALAVLNVISVGLKLEVRVNDF